MHLEIQKFSRGCRTPANRGEGRGRKRREMGGGT